jgi:NAD(P)-dependent dehydrogenase (short-subunit alcohol dehydrogenase family)
MGRLDGKVAIITGSGRGQGQAAARLFAREGARVVVSDVNVEGGEATARQIRDTGGEAMFQAADVSKAADVEALVEASVSAYGALHVLYNNAAIWSGRELDNYVTELSEDGWDRVISINLKGVFLCCKYGIPAIISTGGGSVINTASVAGIAGSRNRSHAYSASKGGVVSMTRAMAVAYARDNVRVNAICPGGVDTPMIASMIDTEERRQRSAASHPLGRMGTPEDIAYFALYLASDESSWVTGGVFPIDGGFTAQ